MKKIEALKKTVYNLENDVYEYNWNSSDSCNCGVLAKSIMGTSRNGSVFSEGYRIADPGTHIEGVFSRNFEACKTTGLELPKVFKSLHDTGFTYKELLELEYLRSETILHFNYGYANKDNLIAYLKKWIEILEADQLPPAIRETIRYVAVPETISEQAVMIITQN